MVQKGYSAGMVQLPFWFLEFKKVMLLLHEGMTLQEIKIKNKEENIFSAISAERANRSFNTVSRRIKALDKSYIDLFPMLDVTNQKIVALIAIMNDDMLFFEFMHETVREKFILGVHELGDSDISIFFRNKQTQDEKVGGWTDLTLRKLSIAYKNVLKGSGLVDQENDDKLYLRKPILDYSLEELLKETRQIAILNILQGVR
jgi:hypothetical protein